MCSLPLLFPLSLVLLVVAVVILCYTVVTELFLTRGSYILSILLQIPPGGGEEGERGVSQRLRGSDLPARLKPQKPHRCWFWKPRTGTDSGLLAVSLTHSAGSLCPAKSIHTLAPHMLPAAAVSPRITPGWGVSREQQLCFNHSTPEEMAGARHPHRLLGNQSREPRASAPPWA